MTRWCGRRCAVQGAVKVFPVIALRLSLLLLASGGFPGLAPATEAPAPAWTVPCRLTAVAGLARGTQQIEALTTADLSAGGVPMLPKGTRLTGAPSLGESTVAADWTATMPTAARGVSTTMLLRASLRPAPAVAKFLAWKAGQVCDLRIEALRAGGTLSATPVAPSTPAPKPEPVTEPTPRETPRSATPAAKGKKINR